MQRNQHSAEFKEQALRKARALGTTPDERWRIRWPFPSPAQRCHRLRGKTAPGGAAVTAGSKVNPQNRGLQMVTSLAQY